MFLFIGIFIFLFNSIIIPQGQFNKTFRISWSEAENASAYLVEISTDPTFNRNVVIREITKETTLLVELGMEVYYFRIAGINADNIVGPWSEVKKFTVEAPNLENIHVSEEDFATLFMPEEVEEIDNFSKGKDYYKIKPYDYDTVKLSVLEQFGGDLPPKLLINILYYISFSHYERGNEYDALLYYREAEKINKSYFRGTYKIKTYYILGEEGNDKKEQQEKVSVKTLSINELKIKFISTKNYKLDEFFIELIENYINSADNFYYKGYRESALSLYELVLILDPYNEYVYEIVYKKEPPKIIND